MAKPLSREQRTWLKDLGTLVGQAPSHVIEEKPAGDGPKGIVGGGDTKALFGSLIPGVPDIKSIIGFSHEVDLKTFRKTFPSVPPDAPVTDYFVEAYLPPEWNWVGISIPARVRDT